MAVRSHCFHCCRRRCFNFICCISFGIFCSLHQAPAQPTGVFFVRSRSKKLLQAPVLLVVLALSACTTPFVRTPWTPVQSLLEQRQRHVVVQQWDLSCGAAALATLMNFQHGEAFTEKAVAESMLQRVDPLTVRIKGGFSLLDMKRFAQRHGYRGRGFMQLPFDQLSEMVPVIVPVDLGGYRHFVIVRAELAGRVLLADPAFGNRSLPAAEFTRAWLSGIAFVVQRRDGLAPPERIGVEAVDFVRVPSQIIRQALR